MWPPGVAAGVWERLNTQLMRESKICSAHTRSEKMRMWSMTVSLMRVFRFIKRMQLKLNMHLMEPDELLFGLQEKWRASGSWYKHESLVSAENRNNPAPLVKAALQHPKTISVHKWTTELDQTCCIMSLWHWTVFGSEGFGLTPRALCHGPLGRSRASVESVWYWRCMKMQRLVAPQN